MLISRSTTPDLLKIFSKLEEFIMQQFDSSKRALGAMGPISANVRQRLQEKHRSGDDDSCEYFFIDWVWKEKLKNLSKLKNFQMANAMNDYIFCWKVINFFCFPTTVLKPFLVVFKIYIFLEGVECQNKYTVKPLIVTTQKMWAIVY